MRNLRNTKEDFVKGVSERIKDGTWGLDEVEYLNEYHAKYHLNYEDIGIFLSQVLEYTYGLALEDGLISEAENEQLSAIMKASKARTPANRAERNQLKEYIMGLVRRFERTHLVQQEITLDNKVQHEQTLQQEPKIVNEPETVKQRVNSVYYRNPYPKCTPYTYY